MTKRKLKIHLHKVIKNKIQLSKGLFLITADQDKLGYNFGADEIILNPKQELKPYNVIRSKQKLIESTSTRAIDFINLTPSQILSVGTGLVPFLEHNDANRGLMGSNMQRQSLPLLYKETPLVRTEQSRRVGKNSTFTITAKASGLVEYVSCRKIVIKEMLQTEVINSEKMGKFQQNKLVQKLKSVYKKYKPKNYKRQYYFLKKERRSNQNTLIKQTPIIKKNDWVIKGQVIVDNNSTLNGELAIGRNILIGYLCWDGYNFEDAIIISEKIVKNDVFTSMHIKKYKTYITNDKTGEVRI
jgi:DNA-directed RNA polymerase subunit beta